MLDRRACSMAVHAGSPCMIVGRDRRPESRPATPPAAQTPNRGYPVPPRHPNQDLPRNSAETCRPEGALYTPHPGRETSWETIQRDCNRGCSSVVERHVANVNVGRSNRLTRFRNRPSPEGRFHRSSVPMNEQEIKAKLEHAAKEAQAAVKQDKCLDAKLPPKLKHKECEIYGNQGY